MRNNRLLLPVLILAAFGLTACDNGTETENDQAATEGAEPGQPATETEEAATETEMAARDMTGTEQADAAVALTVEESTEYGEYLADEEGRALYVYTQDAQGQSSCTDACAEEWPPLTADQGLPRAEDPEIEEARLSTIQREDGTMQVTYNDQPLYYYAQDQASGEPQGQNVDGQWYLVDAQGEEVREQGEQSSEM